MGSKSRDGGGVSRLSEYLLYAAICMVGLPVEVQVKDGSLYSGILHTASFDDSHGIVLKKARKIGKGKHERSFTVGSLVDTLVVFSADFVQVVVKDFLLPAEGVVGDVAGTIEFQANSSFGKVDHNSNKDAKVKTGVNDEKEDGGRGQEAIKAVEPSLKPSVSVQESQVGEDVPKGEATSHRRVDYSSEVNEGLSEDHCQNLDNVSPAQADFVADTTMTSCKASKEMRVSCPPANTVRLDDLPERMVANSTNYPSSDAETNVSGHYTSVSNSRASSCPSPSTSPNLSFSKNNSSSNPVSKGFKLNPGAKVFSPMSANSRSSPAAVPTVPNATYVSNIPPTMQIAVPQVGTEINSFASRSSPAKLVQYDSLLAGYSGVPAQYSRPVIGHASGWQQPVRFNGPYHPLQAGPASYVQPTSQAVMVGRTGQLVYMHPLAQDAIQAASVFSQGSPYPLLNPCQNNVPKIQGTTTPPLQFCMAPPLITGATQPFAVPSHIPFSQPFPAVRPILVPGGNGFFGSKFQ